jgi:hypothetical protein
LWLCFAAVKRFFVFRSYWNAIHFLGQILLMHIVVGDGNCAAAADAYVSAGLNMVTMILRGYISI